VKARAALLVVSAGAALSPARLARADGESLRQEADRGEDEWRKAGAIVMRSPTRFLYDNETSTLLLPESDTSPQACTTVAMIGGRGVSFHAKVPGAEDDPLSDDSPTRAASVAGVLEISGCGAAAPPLERLHVTSDAGRGALEIVVARSARPMAAIRTLLPERTGGALPAPPDAGMPPLLAPPEKRADAAEARAKRDGASVLPRTTWAASEDGSGDERVQLAAGCHRVEIFAPDTRVRPVRRRRLDVDAEIRDADEELLARDRTDGADARLEVCVGEAVDATVIFAGAPVKSSVTVSHAWWPIPPHVPSSWGPEPRARIAHALLGRKAMAPTEEPVALYGGLAGATPIPLPVEAGACYLAVTTVTNGHARGLGLRAAIGAHEVHDERTREDDAAIVAFCATDEPVARLEVEARGASITWGLAVYRMEGRAWLRE
jgi:hypothetical protein